MARHLLGLLFWQKMFQLMHQVASDAFIIGNLNALAFCIMGHFRNQRHPSLAHLTVKNSFKKIGDDNRPEPFIRGFSIAV